MKIAKKKINWSAILNPEKITPASTRAGVIAATVRLPRKQALGVYVGGGFILTAAHCVTYDGNGAMALGDPFIEQVETSKGSYWTDVVAVEPVSDIAVLKATEDDSLVDDWEKHLDFCNETRPVALLHRPRSFTGLTPVHILTPTMKWVKGIAQVHTPGLSTSEVIARESIMGGASGGPIIDAAAQLVGITSIFSDPGPVGVSGPAPCPCCALPGWIYKKICAAVEKSGE